MPGPIAECVLDEKAARMRIPRGLRLYLKLQGKEIIEFLPTTADIPMEDLMDNCVILHVRRGEKK